MKRWQVILFVVAAIQPCLAQNVLKEIIRDNKLDVKYHALFEYPTRYHFQVIYTQVNRDSDNVPHLKRYSLYPPTTRYFYPASLVKLPLVALALEKIDSLSSKGITKDTRLYIDSAHSHQTREWIDSTAKTAYPSIAQYIKRMLLVSDNMAYNRIYEFLTPAYINRRLHELGYKKIMINQRLGGGCDSTENRYTNPFLFLSPDSSLIYKQPADSDMAPIVNSATHTTIGRAFLEDKRRKKPKNFKRNNYIPFQDENNILLSIIFPQAFDSSQRFRLTDSDYRFLYTYMGMLPRESDYPHYDRKDYHDNFKKYIYYGTTDSIPDSSSVRSLNIVGRAYGFLADCAYIMDTATHSEFCLSVLMYVNANGVLNDGKYQYQQIALPFMSDLGHAVLNYEQTRTKKYEPDLSMFKNLWRVTK